MSQPVLTTDGEGHDDIDNALIVNGRIDIRRTHPNKYLVVMTAAVTCVLLGANFYVFRPTFEVWHLSNYVWATTWLTLGVVLLVSLNVWRSLKRVRLAVSFSVSYTVFFAIGTCEPWLDGVGSLQLPIVYLGMAAAQFPMLIEPFLNLWTAKREAP